MLLQQLPLSTAISQNNALNGAFKVIVPEGATGTLMKYKNGLLGTPIIGENKKIVAHAGLEEIKSISLTPVMLFSAMSVITGQYFMSRIDESLCKIEKNVNEIIELIYDEKESDNLAIYNFFKYVNINLQTLIDNREMKIATLTNIQNYNNKLHSNILFYSKSIKRLIKDLKLIIEANLLASKKLERVEEIDNKMEKIVNQQHLFYQLLCIGKVCEIQIAQCYDKEYYSNLIKDLTDIGESIGKDINTLIENVSSAMLEVLIKAKMAGKKSIDKYKENEKKNKEIQKQFEVNCSNLLDKFEQFKCEIDKPKEIYVINEEVYIDNKMS
ncbi:MAG: hypothetical protein IJ086_15690 [Clostridium sp.]|nr:hypothetical protein [Clostridium sp.]